MPTARRTKRIVKEVKSTIPRWLVKRLVAGFITVRLIAKLHAGGQPGAKAAAAFRIGILGFHGKRNPDPLDRRRRRRSAEVVSVRIVIGKKFADALGNDIGDQAVAVAPDNVRSRTSCGRPGDLIAKVFPRVVIGAVTVAVKIHLNMQKHW